MQEQEKEQGGGNDDEEEEEGGTVRGVSGSGALNWVITTSDGERAAHAGHDIETRMGVAAAAATTAEAKLSGRLSPPFNDVAHFFSSTRDGDGLDGGGMCTGSEGAGAAGIDTLTNPSLYDHIGGSGTGAAGGGSLFRPPSPLDMVMYQQQQQHHNAATYGGGTGNISGQRGAAPPVAVGAATAPLYAVLSATQMLQQQQQQQQQLRFAPTISSQLPGGEGGGGAQLQLKTDIQKRESAVLNDGEHVDIAEYCNVNICERIQIDESQEEDGVDYEEDEDGEQEDEEGGMDGQIDVGFASRMAAHGVTDAAPRPEASVDTVDLPTKKRKRRRSVDGVLKYVPHETAVPDLQNDGHVRESNTKALTLSILTGKLDAATKQTGVAGMEAKEGREIEVEEHTIRDVQEVAAASEVTGAAAAAAAAEEAAAVAEIAVAAAAETAVDLESTDVIYMRSLSLDHVEPEHEQHEQQEQAESATQQQKRRKRKNNTDASEAGTSTDPLLTQDNEHVRAQAKKGKQSSSSSLQYKGVTQDRRTGRWVAHLWDNGQIVYLGRFDTEEKAARAFDLFALKCRGSKAKINFLVEDYTEELAQVIH